MPPQTLVLYSSVNTPGINVKTGRPWRDSTHAFAPGALAFQRRMDQKLLPATLVGIDCSKPRPARRHQVLQAFEHAGSVSVVAMFCHGYERGVQMGYDVEQVGELADLIERAGGGAVPNPRVILYACEAGDSNVGPGGDGGFADALRDELCERRLTGCQVDAHTTTGHSYQNPHVRRFLGMGSPTGGSGGTWVVQPGKKMWAKWRARMADPHDPLWMDFPFMSIAQIHAELSPAGEDTRPMRLTPSRGIPGA
jgi:hypothetical protein